MASWDILFASFLIFLTLNLAVVHGTFKSFNDEEHETFSAASSSYKLSPRIFDFLLRGENNIVDTTPFNHSDFTDGSPVSPEELGNLDEGDISGYGGHVVKGRDGQRHFHISIWPNGVVPYVIVGPFKFTNARTRIKEAFKEFHRHTCIRFVPRTKEEAYLIIKDNNKPTCSSFIGNLEKPQIVNLGLPRCKNFKTLIHELMHAIGFIHEQSRPDRDKYIEVHLENLSSEKKRHNFRIDPDMFQEVGVPYDLGSVMQYSEGAFAKKNMKTMKARNGKKLGNKKGFAMSDIKEINRLYQCEGQER